MITYEGQDPEAPQKSKGRALTMAKQSGPRGAGIQFEVLGPRGGVLGRVVLDYRTMRDLLADLQRQMPPHDPRLVMALNGDRKGQRGHVINPGSENGWGALVRWEDGSVEAYSKGGLINPDDFQDSSWRRPMNDAEQAEAAKHPEPRSSFIPERRPGEDAAIVEAMEADEARQDWLK